MFIVSYNGFNFADNGFSCDFPEGADRGTFGVEASMQRRPGYSSRASGVAVTEMTVPVEIGYGGVAGFSYPAPSDSFYEDAWAELMAGLEPTKTAAKLLVAERNDGTEVSCMARVILPQGSTLSEDVNFVVATFMSEEPRWTVVTPPAAVTHSQTTTVDPTWSSATAYTALGSAPIHPLVTINPATTGTQPQRYSFTVTNNLAYTLRKWPVYVDLGNTSGWTGSTAANTFVFCDGVEQPREVIAMGETKSWLLIVPDSIASGQVKTYEILTGGTTPALSTTAAALNGRQRAIVPDPGWQVIAANATGTTTAINFPASSFEANRWKGGRVFALTGPKAGEKVRISGNTTTQIQTTGDPFSGDPNAGSVGAKFLLMASHLDSGVSELILAYAVRQTEHSDYPHGLWYEGSSQNAPKDVRYDSPATWRPVKSFPDAANRDDIAQPSVTAINVGTTDYFTILNAYRTWEHGLKNSDVRERGAADGVAFSSPVPIKRFRRELTFLNPNGVGKAIVGSRQIMAADWTEVYTDTTAHATPTTLSDTEHTLQSATRHLLVALWPAIGSEIPTSWARDTGTRTGGGANSMSDDSKSWVDDQWVGGRWKVTDGKGQGISRGPITSNDDNTVNWTTAIADNDDIPNDGSRYEITQKPLIANLQSGAVWIVTLDVSGIAVSAITSMGTAERVAVRIRAGSATDNSQLDVGAGTRKLWIAAGNTVVVDTDAQTAKVMNGSTVLKDVTDWVESYEQVGGATRTVSRSGWFPIDPGAGNFYHQRTAGASTYSIDIVLSYGFLG